MMERNNPSSTTRTTRTTTTTTRRRSEDEWNWIKPYSYDHHNPTYISRIGFMIYLVQSPIQAAQLSPELLPNKYHLNTLQNGLQSLNQSQINLPLLSSTTSSSSSTIPMDPSIEKDPTSIAIAQKANSISIDQHQANITNEQITFEQLSQLPENTPTIISEEEFDAFFRILAAAQQSQLDQSIISSIIEEESIPVEVVPSSSTSKSNKRSRNSMTASEDQNTHTPTPPKSDHKKLRRTTATFAQKIEVLNWYHENGESQTGTARHFEKIYPELRIKQPLVSAWVKDELHIRALAPPGSTTAKRVRGTTHPEVTSMLEEWVQQAILAKINITGDVICEKWKHFAQLCGIPSAEWLTLSHGWLDAFRQRNGLRHFKPIPDIPISSKPQPESDLARLTAIISQYAPEDVYNMDETGLFYAMPPDKELAEQQREEGKIVKGSDQGIEDPTKQVKTKLTIALACNSDGSDRLPPLFIGKTDQPTLTNPTFDQQPGFEYRQNSKTTMTSTIFQQWILSWNQKLTQQARSILLLIDTFVGHVLPSVKLDSIRVEFFSSNVQPLTAGIIQSFKSNYRRRFTSRAIRRFDEVPASEIYSIDPVTAMRLCRAAWNAVPVQIIQSAWTNTGLIKLEPIDPPLPEALQAVEDEPELTSDLQVLQDIGVLSDENRMETHEILEPIGESVADTTLWTPEQIFHHTRSQSQTPQSQTPQTQTENIPSQTPTIPTQLQVQSQSPSNERIPSLEETIRSVKRIIRYLEIDDSIEGQSLEPLLESFARRLNEKNKKILDEKSLPQIG